MNIGIKLKDGVTSVKDAKVAVENYIKNLNGKKLSEDVVTTLRGVVPDNIVNPIGVQSAITRRITNGNNGSFYGIPEGRAYGNIAGAAVGFSVDTMNQYNEIQERINAGASVSSQEWDVVRTVIATITSGYAGGANSMASAFNRNFSGGVANEYYNNEEAELYDILRSGTSSGLFGTIGYRSTQGLNNQGNISETSSIRYGTQGAGNTFAAAMSNSDDIKDGIDSVMRPIYNDIMPTDTPTTVTISPQMEPSEMTSDEYILYLDVQVRSEGALNGN